MQRVSRETTCSASREKRHAARLEKNDMQHVSRETTRIKRVPILASRVRRLVSRVTRRVPNYGNLLLCVVVFTSFGKLLRRLCATHGDWTDGLSLDTGTVPEGFTSLLDSSV